jgi:hypothetical protein
MNGIDFSDIDWSNFKFENYLEIMEEKGINEELAEIMFSNFIYSKIQFCQTKNKIEYNEIIDGKYLHEKKALENILIKEERKRKQIEYANKLTLAFQSVAFESDKLILNKKYADGSIKLSDDVILEMLKEKKYLECHLEKIQPFAETMDLVSSINDDVRNLFQLNVEQIITLCAYFDLGILITQIDREITSQLLSAGLMDDDLIWLIPYKQIIIEFYRIHFFNFYLISLTEFDTSLKYFVQVFIRKALLNRLAVKSKKYKVIMNEIFIKSQLENWEDKIQRNQKLGIESNTDIVTEMFSIFNKYFTPDLFEIPNKNFSNFEQFLKYAMSNNFDSILTPIYTKHSYNLVPEKKASVKLRAFYKLYSLMMPHRKWDISPDYIQNQQQEITKKMRKFITKK